MVKRPRNVDLQLGIDDIPKVGKLAKIPRRLKEYNRLNKFLRRKGKTPDERVAISAAILAKRGIKEKVMSPTSFLLDMGDEVGRGIRMGLTEKPPNIKKSFLMAKIRAKRTVTRAKRNAQQTLEKLRNLRTKGKKISSNDFFLSDKQLKHLSMAGQGKGGATPNPFHNSRPFFYRRRNGRLEKVRNKFFNTNTLKSPKVDVVIDHDSKEVKSIRFCSLGTHTSILFRRGPDKKTRKRRVSRLGVIDRKIARGVGRQAGKYIRKNPKALLPKSRARKRKSVQLNVPKRYRLPLLRGLTEGLVYG